MSHDGSPDVPYQLLEKGLMVLGLGLLVVSIVIAAPLGALSPLDSGADGPENEPAAAGATDTPDAGDDGGNATEQGSEEDAGTETAEDDFTSIWGDDSTEGDGDGDDGDTQSPPDDGGGDDGGDGGGAGDGGDEATPTPEEDDDDGDDDDDDDDDDDPGPPGTPPPVGP